MLQSSEQTVDICSLSFFGKLILRWRGKKTVTHTQTHTHTFIDSGVSCPPWLFHECICMQKGHGGRGRTANMLHSFQKRGDALRGCKLSVSLKPAPSLSLSPLLYGRVIPSVKMCVPVNVHFLVCVCLCVCSCACTCVKIWRVCYTFLAAHSRSIKTAKRKNNLFPNGKLLKLFTAELLVNKRAWLLIFERYTDARAHTHRVVELVFLFCWHQRDREERIKQPSLPPSIPRSFSSSPPHSNASVSWTARTGGERERGRERTREREAWGNNEQHIFLI